MSEHEKFRKWWVGLATKIPNKELMEFYSYDGERAAWIAYQAACPEGWQVVPRELNIAMIEDFEDRLSDQGWLPDDVGEICKQDLWDAMLDAAPTPGDEGYE